MLFVVSQVKVYFIACVYGLVVIMLCILGWIRNPKDFFTIRKRNKPPNCLMDPSLGTHSYVKLKKTKLHYVENGDPSRRLLLCLHGFPEFWYSWRYQLRELAHSFWVVALDLKGFGDSDKPTWSHHYRMDTLVEELKDFLIALGKPMCILMAHDLGGLVAWHFVSQYPEMVSKFIPICSIHPEVYLWDINSSWRTFLKQWQVYFYQLPYLPEREIMKEDLVIFDKLFGRSSLSRDELKEQLEAYKFTFSRLGDWHGPINYFRNMPLAKGMNGSPKLNVPTMFIMGKQNSAVSLESICRSSEYTDNFCIRLVEGTGHYVHQENAETVNRLICKYLIAEPKHQAPVPSPSIMGKFLHVGRSAVNSTVIYGNQMMNQALNFSETVISETAFSNVNAFAKRALFAKTHGYFKTGSDTS